MTPNAEPLEDQMRASERLAVTETPDAVEPQDDLRAAKHEVTRRCVVLIREQELTPPEAVIKVMSDDMDADLLCELARVGLLSLVGSELWADRRRAERASEIDAGHGSSRSGRYQLRSLPNESSARWYWLSKTYATADGHQAPILTFGGDDLAAARGRFADKLKTITALDGFFGMVEDEMRDHPRAKRVSDLPAKVLERLESVAASVLGGVA